MEYYLQTLARELGVALVACAPLAQRIARFEHKTQRENTRIRDRTKGPTHVLFLCREESSQRRRTAIYPVFMKREHSGLVTDLILSQRMSDPFDDSSAH